MYNAIRPDIFLYINNNNSKSQMQCFMFVQCGFYMRYTTSLSLDDAYQILMDLVEMNLLTLEGKDTSDLDDAIRRKLNGKAWCYSYREYYNVYVVHLSHFISLVCISLLKVFFMINMTFHEITNRALIWNHACRNVRLRESEYLFYFTELFQGEYQFSVVTPDKRVKAPKLYMEQFTLDVCENMMVRFGVWPFGKLKSFNRFLDQWFCLTSDVSVVFVF